MQPARIAFIVMALFTHVADSVMNPKSVKWTSGLLTILEKEICLLLNAHIHNSGLFRGV